MNNNENRVLVGGYINTNVIDGSAIFISSLAQVLALNKNLQIDVLLAVPHERDVVLGPLLKLDNVNIIDPFLDTAVQNILKYPNRMTKKEYANLVRHYDYERKYEQLFIRSFEVVDHLIIDYPQVINRLLAYITGITNKKHIIDEQQQMIIKTISQHQGKLLCQTPEMKTFILSQLNIEEQDIIYLNPMIPNNYSKFENIFKKKTHYNTFCYTGKFAYEWNINQMIVQFREINELYPESIFYIAGDQFKHSLEDELFATKARYLLNNSNNVKWLGAIPREKSLALIKQCDIGLSYRNSTLDDSLELSTKLLEYCSLAVPPIINRNEMHVRIFGDEYPYYVNSDEELFETMKRIIENPEEYEETAKHVYRIANEYSYYATYLRLKPYLNLETIEQADDLTYLTMDDDAIATLKTILSHNKIELFNYNDGIISFRQVPNKTNTIDEIVDMMSMLATKEEDLSIDLNHITPTVDNSMHHTLKRENEKLRRDIKRFRQKYNNLSNSKLGAIQKKYWKLRAKR